MDHDRVAESETDLCCLLRFAQSTGMRHMPSCT